jgi:hypothetical protein
MSSPGETRDAVKFYFLLFGVILACVFTGRVVVEAPPWMLLSVVGLAVAFLTFLFPKIGLALVVFSMIFSPKVEGFQIAEVSRHGAATFKANDVLLIVILFAWVARTAVFKGTTFLVSTPLNGSILLFSCACLISTLFGIMRGNLIGALRPLFYVLKYIEYYVLFFMTVNVVESRDDARRYLKYGWITALLVTVFGYSQIPSGERVTAPFDEPVGSTRKGNEANTFGGYYLVVFGLLLGYFTQGAGNAALGAVASLVFMLPPFLLTQSRSSYLGLAAGVVYHMLSTPKRQMSLLTGLCLSLILVISIPKLRDTVVKRVEYTFGAYGDTMGSVQIGGERINLEGSTYIRVQNWERIFTQQFPVHPIFGYGVTGVGLSDAYYPLLIGETGLVGFCLFFYMISRIWRCAWELYKLSPDPLDKSLALGLLTALVGLLLHGLGANTFILVRIMEPFWFATALMARLRVELDRGGARAEVSPAPAGAAA